MYTKQSSAKIQELKSPALSIKTGYLDDDFRIFSLVSEEEREFQPHYHSFHKLLFFESGNVSYYVEGETYELQPFDLVPVSYTHLTLPTNRLV